MEHPISPPRVTRRGNGTTRYEKEVASTPKLADDPNERKWIGPWLLGETIGKGASGRVRLAKHKRTKKIAAIKIIPKVHIGASRVDPKAERVMQSIRREMVVMKLIHHEHIMDMYDVYEDKDDLYLLLEYVEGGELFDYLVSKGRLELHEAITYFRQIISGVNYCHKFNIAHRDLKPENLLLDKNKNIKIADFGMAALEYDGTAFLETSCGSPHYASPEVVAGNKYHGNASDIWSCGVVLFALLTGRLPFDHENMGELLRRVKAGRFEMPRSIPPEAKDLLSRILRVDPAQRIKMGDIIRHPFFSLATTTRVGPQDFSGPNFYPGQGRVIQSELNIDEGILENLVSLFRKMSRGEIVQKLLSQGNNWEKTFYFLLLEYHERQSEEYGHGMNFTDLTGREEPAITRMHRKRLSEGSNGSYKLNILSAQQPSSVPTAIPTSTTPPLAEARMSEGSPPVATRSASSPTNDPRRRRSAVAGPRPHGSRKENTSPCVSAENSPTSSPEKKKDEVMPPAPSRPERNAARVAAPTSLSPPSMVIDDDKTPTAADFPHMARLIRPRAHTVASERIQAPIFAASPPAPAAQKAPDPLAVSPGSHLDKPRPNHDTSQVQDSRRPHPAVDGVDPQSRSLALVKPPSSSRPDSRAEIRGPSKTTTLSKHPATHARHYSASSPRTDMPPPAPRHTHRMSVDLQMPRERRDLDGIAPQSWIASPAKRDKRPPSLVLDDTRSAGSYPSPPPSQASSLEPFLVLQQSPVFSERFSLHLDAMLMSPARPASMDMDMAEQDEDEMGNDDTDLGSARQQGLMDVDPPTAPASATGPKRESHLVTQIRSPSAIAASVNGAVPVERTARLVDRRSRASTGAITMGGDWSFLAEAEEARQAVPNVAEAQQGMNLNVSAAVVKKPKAQVQVALPSTVVPTSQAPRSAPPISHRAPPQPQDSGGQVKSPTFPLDRHLSKKTKTKTVIRRSTFVVVPPSPALHTTLEPVQSGWFGQLFRVKPACYVFHSLESFVNTRNECATLLRSFGVCVEELQNEGKYGILRSHVDFVQEDNGRMINKPITFRAQITPHFTVRSPNFARTSTPSQTPSAPVPPAETCTLSLIQEHGAKSTLEVIAARFRQEWRLDNGMTDPATPRIPITPRGF